MRLTLITLALLAVILTACTGDPLGLAARQQIITDGDIEIARIDASTARLRLTGAITGAGIGGLVVVLVVAIGALTHLQAQRDRLSADQWRNQLPVIPTTNALPAARPAGHWLAITRPSRQQTEPHTLALPARSASHSDVVVIDR